MMKKLLMICALSSVFLLGLNAEESKEEKNLLNRIDTTFQKFNTRSTIRDIPREELDATLKSFEQLSSDLKDAQQKGILKDHTKLLKDSIGKLNSLIETTKARKKFEDQRDKASATIKNAHSFGFSVNFGRHYWDKSPPPDYNKPL